MKDTHIRQCLDEGLSCLSYTERQHQDMLNDIVHGGKHSMKKRIPFSILLSALLLFLSVTGALAASGALEELWEVWKASFDRMNTTGALNALDEEAYSQTVQEMAGKKEDLIVSTVPREGDLSYDEALAIARRAIEEAFATPAEELDAMGVYPEFFVEPFEGEEPSRWYFYITPRTDVNIDEDHDYPAPGEYLVDVASPSGEVTMLVWHNDDFWPDYALRVWNGGNHAYVYDQALHVYGFGNGFADQSAQDKEMFLKLFEEDGYDISPLRQDPETLFNGPLGYLMYEEADKDLTGAGTPGAENALRAIQESYGFSREQMKKYCFRLLRYPMDSDTEDYCAVFNWNMIYPELAAPQNPTGGVGRFQLSVYREARRLGFFLVRLDPETHAVKEVLHVNNTNLDANFTESDKLLGRKNWTVADLAEYDELYSRAQALDAAVAAGEMTEAQARDAYNAFIVDYGGEPAPFPIRNE